MHKSPALHLCLLWREGEKAFVFFDCEIDVLNSHMHFLSILHIGKAIVVTGSSKHNIFHKTNFLVRISIIPVECLSL